jgi:carboxyl-terminal processing protease
VLMFGEDKQPESRAPEEHYVEKGRRPLLKIFGGLIVLLIVFGAGVALGRSNIDLLSSKKSVNNSAPNRLDYSSVNQVYNILRSDFDGNLNQQKLIDGLKTGLVNSAGDPYTEYFSAADAKSFNEQLAGSITGIGAELGTDSDNNIVIISPLSGYPAEKAGLKPHDIIAAVDGKSTQGMSVDSVVSKIRGKEGSQVTLTIVRGAAKPFEAAITRQKITVPSVKYEEDGQIGYMKINQFTDDTVSLAQKGAQEFKAKNVKAVVLDLRGNPGGYLSGAVSISSLWLNKGQTVVQERRGSTVTGTEYASGNNILGGLPTVVLIDGGSASASEITAGALHDNGDARLVGVKSFGKGSVQEVECLGNNGMSLGSNTSNCQGPELKVTIAHWYTPKGKNIDKQGITPDAAVQVTDQQATAGQDPQKDKAFAIVQAQIH